MNLSAENITGGFQFTEGPVWVPQRSELIFSDIPASKMYRFKDGKLDLFRDPSGNANGNTLDRQGRLLTCEHGHRRVSRTEADGRVVTLADRFEGKRLNSPNDIVCKSDGAIYFTDPPYGVKPELRELDFQGVYRLLDGQLALFARDFVKPNGLVFSPDEKRLYIADTEMNHIRVFDATGNNRVFCHVERPDGMRVDVAGNLYVAAMNAVEIFDPTGKKISEITLAKRPSNLAFGDADRCTLYITARTGLYRVRVTTPGL